MIKKILLPLFSLFLLYRTYDLMRDLNASLPSDYSSLEMFFIAFLLSLFITGVFALPGFAFPTNRIIGLNYYTLKNPESLARLYNVLSVDHFKKMLLIIFWVRRKNRKKYFDGKRTGIDNFLYQSKQSEFGHLGAFVSISILSFVLILKGYTLLFAFITLINIVGNFYPIVLQRYHRLRIEKVVGYSNI